MDSIDTILFDWDGTLIDSAQLSFDAFKKTLGEMGIIIEFELYERIYSPNWYGMYQAVQLPKERWPEADKLWILHYGRGTPVLVQGGRQVLNELSQRGYCLGIVTSGSRLRVKREINALGLAETFRTVICNEDVVNKKPHPEGLQKAMKRLDKRPAACCYVGDSPDDIEMGRRANVQTIGIPGGYPCSRNLPSANPDYCFESIMTLLNHFQALNLRLTIDG